MAARIRSLAPMQQLGLEKEKHESNKWIAQWMGDDDGNRYKVYHYKTKVDVDLNTGHCTCRLRQLTGITFLTFMVVEFNSFAYWYICPCIYLIFLISYYPMFSVELN